MPEHVHELDLFDNGCAACIHCLYTLTKEATVALLNAKRLSALDAGYCYAQMALAGGHPDGILNTLRDIAKEGLDG